MYAIAADNKDYLEQINALKADPQGLQSRNISWEQYLLDNRTALCFHKQHIEEDFTIVLNNSEGEEKFRSIKPVLPTQIYQMVEAMPINAE